MNGTPPWYGPRNQGREVPGDRYHRPVDAGGDIIGTAGGARPGSGGTPPTPRIRVLVAIKCLGFGGAERLLVDMVARGDRRAFDYEVAYVLSSENALAPVIVDG